MMYRFFAINRVAIENCRLAVYGHKKHVRLKGNGDGKIVYRHIPNSLLLQPLKYKTINNDQQKAVYCHLQQIFQLANPVIQSEGFVEKIQSTQNQDETADVQYDTGREHKNTPLNKKTRHSKYAYSSAIDTDKNDRKSRKKRAKAKKLQELIVKAQEEIIKKIENKKLKLTSERTKPYKKRSSNNNFSTLFEPIECEKLNMEDFDRIILEDGCFDDKPMIFFAKDHDLISKQVINSPEKIQQIIESFHNFQDMAESQLNDRFEYDDESTTASKRVLVDIAGTLKTPFEKKDAILTKNSEARFKSKVYQNELQERLAKEKALRLNLTAYLNVCTSVGLKNQGLSTILNYRQRAQKNNTNNLITIDLYNILLHGYAEHGSFDRFRDIFKLIKEDGLKFNEQTFAAIFECLGRLEMSPDNVEEIQTYIKEAEDMNITLHQIMDKSKFISDQREIALDAIRRVLPDFKPIYTPPHLEYNNPLINSLNKKVLKFDEKIHSKNDTSKKMDCAEIMNSKLGYSKHQLKEMAKKQLGIELDGYIMIKSIWKSKEFSNAEYCREKLKDLETQWRSQINSAIDRDLNAFKSQSRFKAQGYMNFHTYLKTLDPSQYADIIIKEIYKLAEGSDTYSPTVGQLYKELGQKVQQRYQVEQKKKNGVLEKIGIIYNDYCDIWDHGNTSDNTRQIWQRIVHRERTSGPSMDAIEIAWPTNVLSGVGRFLYNILMRDIKIDTFVMRQNQKSKCQNLLPAFYTLFRNQGRMIKEEVKPHPVLTRLLRASRQKTLIFDSNLVPMLCPPKPWSNPHNGGYLLNKSELIRLPQQAVQQWEKINSIPLQNIYPALDSLNQLANVPWRVNTDMLDIIIEVFQNGGDSKLDVPQPPSSLPPLPSVAEKDSSISNIERAKLFREKMAHRRKQAEMHSMWCDALYRISLANHYRDKVFWLPHNMDFRGRVYPIPPHLNHLGSDLARAMLIFDQPQPLGVDGFSWLKLHCINLTGFKKRDSIRERLLYAEEVMPEILDSADNPLTGRKWWAQSDKPWQTLACSKEIAKVYRSPNPEKYLSHFPIHQDGSCNGLQHYAALGLDKAGAISVNLSPSPKPQDVYSAVVALVENTRKQDAQNGLQVAQALDGFVTRKVIKQTVMTTVYGVTRYGARLQIARQLKDIDDFPKEWVWPASTYLTNKTFESLREMFTSTREIQDWFTECARLIAGVCGMNVEWVTPLGLPVVQPYNRQDLKQTLRPGVRIPNTMSTDMYEKPNIMKQKNAFPPNFIHSLDSTHMMLTSLHCEREGLTFISVHDCFWTHACTVPQLNKICREQFVALHSLPILEDLSQFLKEKYSFKESELSDNDSAEDLAKHHLNRVLRKMPKKGDFDLHNVLDSIYFFS